MKALIVAAAALALCGCPQDPPGAKGSGSTAALIPITSDMSPAQRVIVGELNQTRGLFQQSDRQDLLDRLVALEQRRGGE